MRFVPGSVNASSRSCDETNGKKGEKKEKKSESVRVCVLVCKGEREREREINPPTPRHEARERAYTTFCTPYRFQFLLRGSRR